MVTGVDFYKVLKRNGIERFYGVPDSQLLAFTNAIMHMSTLNREHFIVANEGNAVAMATGHYLATGIPSVIYMQNSGLGNAVNAITSLTHQHVYDIPLIYVIGWRGQPSFSDEPQHIKQGEITLPLLEILDIKYFVLSMDSTMKGLEEFLTSTLRMKVPGAIVVGKNSIEDTLSVDIPNNNDSLSLMREDVIDILVSNTSINDIFITTTGKTSRELFEIRKKHGECHSSDFLTVGSMGHASSIALGIATEIRKRTWCIDGDGAFFMHMGAASYIGSLSPENLVHIIINNNAHESVGGLPTISNKIDFEKILLGFGYKSIYHVKDKEALLVAISKCKNKKELTGIVIDTNPFSRKDLGRPTVSTIENKLKFMSNLLHGLSNDMEELYGKS